MDHERYQIVRALAAGSETQSWVAHDLTSGELVHIKELRLEHAESWKAVELFEREVATLRKLDHPQIPALIDGWSETDGHGVRFGLARRWVEGNPLSTRLSLDEERFTEIEARELLVAVAPVLAYLHEFRPLVVHRDVTAEHIVKDADGGYHVVGLGGVQAALPRTAGGSTFVGTSGYIPVEQLMGRAIAASDVYALGATCVALLSGLEPSQIPSQSMRLDFEPHVNVSPALCGLLRQMLSPKAERRPPDGSSLVRRLERLDSNLTTYEARLLDDPPPDGVMVNLDGGQLLIQQRNSLRRSGIVEASVWLFLGLCLSLSVVVALAVGLDYLLFVLPFAVIIAAPGTLLAMLVFAVAAKFPYTVRVDEEQISTTFWLRPVPLSDVVDLEEQAGTLMLWCRSGEVRRVLLRSPEQGDWVVARIRERIGRQDD